MRCRKCEERRKALRKALLKNLSKASKRLRNNKAKVISCVLLALIISGCSTVQVAAKLTADEVCDLSVSKRAAVRALVDEATEPHIVRVECRW